MHSGFGKLDDRWEQYYAALDSDRFDRETDCGRIIEVKGLEDGASGKWVRMMIVDECESPALPPSAGGACSAGAAAVQPPSPAAPAAPLRSSRRRHPDLRCSTPLSPCLYVCAAGATCKYNDVDMSMPAFKDVTGFEWDRKRVCTPAAPPPASLPLSCCCGCPVAAARQPASELLLRLPCRRRRRCRRLTKWPCCSPTPKTQVEWRYVNKDRRLSRKMLAGEEEQ